MKPEEAVKPCGPDSILLLLNGPSSAGKSTIAGALRQRLRTREGISAACRYGALALLLAILGCASYAYRARMENAAEEPGPRAEAAVRLAQTTPEPTAAPAAWVWPLEGEIVAGYAPEEPVWSETLGQWQTHPALDIAGSPGEAVVACRDGVVADAWNDRLWGNVIAVDHDDGYRSTYAGLNTLKLVAPGERVSAGQIISGVGNTATNEADLGWHLHFELSRDGRSMDFGALMP